MEHPVLQECKAKFRSYFQCHFFSFGACLGYFLSSLDWSWCADLMGINAHSAAIAAVLVVLSASLLVTMAVVDENPVRQRAGSDGDGENSGWSNTFIHRKSSYSEFCLRSYVDYIGYLDISLTVFWWASSHSQGFEDKNLGRSPGLPGQ